MERHTEFVLWLGEENCVRDILFRQRPSGISQVLVLTDHGLQELEGLADPQPAPRLMQPLQLNQRNIHGAIVPCDDDGYIDDGYTRGTCDLVTGLAYVCTRTCVLQVELDDSNVVTELAGQLGDEEQADGPGHEARIDCPYIIAVDGASLLIKDRGSHRIRRMQFPPAGSPPSNLATTVSTLPTVHAGNVYGIACDYSAQTLFVATRRAIYKYPAPSSMPDGDAATRAITPQLLAGFENGDGARRDGLVLASGHGAQFGDINFVAVDRTGHLLVIENRSVTDDPVLRMVTPGGVVSTIIHAWNLADDAVGVPYRVSILPGGWVAVYRSGGTRISLLRLGLEPSVPPPQANAAAAAQPVAGPGRPGPDGLAADLGDLLTSASSSSDLTILVGDRAFPAHRTVLAARCEYFRRQLDAATWQQGAAPQISLEEADPDAFEQLLRFMYTGSLAFPPALLRPLAALADRLLLPAASSQAQRQLAAAACPATIVADLLWAEQHGFGALLEELKAWYLENAARVLEEAPDSMEELTRASPRLLLELHAVVVKRARLR